jgi:DNA polymerase-3 subunit delta
VVVVNDADVFVSEHRQAMERYAKSPVEQAALVFRSVRWNPGNLDKAIAKVGCVLKCDVLSSSAARGWLERRAQQTHGVKLSAQAAGCLVDRIGSDLGMLDSELGKLVVLAGDRGAVTEALIKQVVSKGSDEEAWAIQQVVLAGISGRSGRGLSVSHWTGAKHQRGGETPGLIEKVHELIDLSGQPDVLVAYFVIDIVRKMYLAVVMIAEGLGEQQVAERLKVFGPRRAAFFAAVRELDQVAAGALFESVVRYDSRAKSGYGGFVRGLECFCAGLSVQGGVGFTGRSGG